MSEDLPNPFGRATKGVVIGPIVIWYLAGITMIAIFGLERISERRASANRTESYRSRRGIQPLFYFAIFGALAIFAVWPWVALTLARNATL